MDNERYSISDLGSLAYDLAENCSALRPHFKLWLSFEAQRIADLSWSRASADIIRYDRADVLSEWEDLDNKGARSDVNTVLRSFALQVCSDQIAATEFSHQVAKFRKADVALLQMKKKGFLYCLKNYEQYSKLRTERRKANKGYTLAQINNIACALLGREFFQSFFD